MSNAPAAQPEIELPTGKKVVFRRLKTKDRSIALDQLIAQRGENASAELLFVELSNYLPRLALVSVDGLPVDSDPDRRMEDWDLRDEDFYLSVFRLVHQMTDEDGKRAADVAKSLR